ncbi:hypothetical protein CEY16_05940 [Halalkalibacillus sediminis]|uniref:YtpI-like protein n=1 Tax=Halalkalibacillus sediminis TaxID=2018042 RepID=A0A2I0QYS7_9BACI|nr:YtpI family protein [Halalkalibacillus sediminis]PKR79280.1 hypothetical protein CEY16_05940 [Halalkalibacillus sediminis]
MPFFISIIVISFILYVFFKVRILNEKEPVKMHYTNAKARMALGTFISAFGINQYVFYETQLALFIGIVFLILGIAQIVYGYKLFKHFRNELLKVSDQ